MPALTGRGYDDMAIADGKQATRRYMHAVHGEAGEGEREEIFRELREYCEQDTEGMVPILEVLRRLGRR